MYRFLLALVIALAAPCCLHPVLKPEVAGGALSGQRPDSVEEVRAVRSSDTYRVMTYNVHHGVDAEGRPTLDKIASIIREASPDLVFIAEADVNWRRSGFVDQVAYLSEATGLSYHYFAPALTTRSMRHTAPGRTARYGNAFLSNRPFATKTARTLPGFAGSEPRNVVRVDVEIAPGKVVRVYGTHLSVAAAERRRQFAVLRGWIGDPSGDVLLLGDLNVPPERLSVEAAFLLSEAWDDVLAEQETEYLTFPARQPTARIDYVFAGGDLAGKLLGAYVPETLASDHRPVVAEFSTGSNGRPFGRKQRVF